MKKAIVTLSKGFSNDYDYGNLILRNKFIEQNTKESYDIIIFYEGNISEKSQQHIKSKTKLTLTFVEIPRFDPIDGICFDSGLSEGFGWGYRHMCHFWFIGFLEYLKDYSYVLRIDDDCIVQSNIDEIFKELEDKVCVYGACAGDHKDVTKGMNDFSLQHIETDLGPRDPSGPYTNLIGFNLLKIKSNERLKSYMDQVDISNNIYIYRWGDLPLWGESLHYLFDNNDHSQLPIKYYHGSHNMFLNY
jgi:hypothetical protein